jgi:fumarate hydratase class II
MTEHEHEYERGHEAHHAHDQGTTRTTRIESDAMGKVPVPADHYWGAQTQRSLEHFRIGNDRMPLAIPHALALIKKASALANLRMGKLEREKAEMIVRVADEVLAGKLDDEFPLSVWQTGSGTQTNMNVNEVISNRAIELTHGELGSKEPIHPNDHVNMSQSSNDTFPAAMHISAAQTLTGGLLPAATALRDAMATRVELWRDVVKIGRTHLQDATPLMVGQEWSGYVAQLDDALARVRQSLEWLYHLPLGGTAVGTGMESPRGFDVEVVREVANLSGLPFVPSSNRYAAMAAMDALVASMATLRGLAVSLFKIAQDIRLLGSGPRAGLGELRLPENEPGSSIMPGKVNPTQCEALLMVCIQVMGEDQIVAQAGAQGNLELNVMRPVAINAFLHSARILGDACARFREYCIEGMALDERRIKEHVENSLMLVTALRKKLGHDECAKIAQNAHRCGLSLEQSAIELGYLQEGDYATLVHPEEMTHPDD